MYAGILFGTIVLTGCNVNEEAQKQVNNEITEGLSDSKIVELPPLEPLDPEITEELSYTEPEVEKLTYEEIVIENPSIAELKTYEQVEKYYNLNSETVTEVPEGVFPLELNSVEEAIEYFEAEKRYQEKNLSVTPLELTQEQKEDYHKQYVEIVEEINAEEGTNYMEVDPIDEFKPEDWVEPEKFRQLAIVRAYMKFE